MGADSSLYGGPWRDLEDTVYLDWPKYSGEKSLSDLGKRLISDHEIKSSDLVAGSSMGGMVALEVAERIGISHVSLIGSAMSRDEINPLLTLLAPLANLTPVRFSHAISGSSSVGFSDMLMKTEPEFIKAMCIAVSTWDGTRVPEDKVTRLHGTHDLIIKCPENCVRIEGAGHLLAMTHPNECVAATKASINEAFLRITYGDRRT